MLLILIAHVVCQSCRLSSKARRLAPQVVKELIRNDVVVRGLQVSSFMKNAMAN